MDHVETKALAAPPDGSSLSFNIDGVTQIVTITAKRFGISNALWSGAAVLIACLFFTLASYLQSDVLLCLGITSLLGISAYFCARNFGAVTILKISNGFLEIENQYLTGTAKSIVSLEKVIETAILPRNTTFAVFKDSKTSLYVRVPTYDFQPLRRFVANRECRRNSILSYDILVAFSSKPCEVEWVENWLDSNLDAVKRTEKRTPQNAG